MRIYLSGKISGLREIDARDLFKQAKVDLFATYSFTEYPKTKVNYCEVINPLELKMVLGKSYWAMMLVDIFHLLRCKKIYMLRNWKNSRGARIEIAIAILTGKEILFQ